jgi:hypothetical protein
MKADKALPFSKGLMLAGPVKLSFDKDPVKLTWIAP